MNCIENIKIVFFETINLLKRGFGCLETFPRMVVQMQDIYVERYEIIGLVLLLSLSVPVISLFNFLMPRIMFNMFLTVYLVRLGIMLFMVLYLSAVERIDIFCMICERSLKMRIENLDKDKYLVRWEEKKYYKFVRSSRNVPAFNRFWDSRRTAHCRRNGIYRGL